MLQTRSNRAAPPEVVRIISTRECFQDLGNIGGGHIEVVEHLTGEWSVWYPEEGWLPCQSDCSKKHSHHRERPHVRSYYKPVDRADALEFAAFLAEGREVKVMKKTAFHAAREEKSAKSDFSDLTEPELVA